MRGCFERSQNYIGRGARVLTAFLASSLNFLSVIRRDSPAYLSLTRRYLLTITTTDMRCILNVNVLERILNSFFSSSADSRLRRKAQFPNAKYKARSATFQFRFNRFIGNALRICAARYIYIYTFLMKDFCAFREPRVCVTGRSKRAISIPRNFETRAFFSLFVNARRRTVLRNI